MYTKKCWVEGDPFFFFFLTPLVIKYKNDAVHVYYIHI